MCCERFTVEMIKLYFRGVREKQLELDQNELMKEQEQNVDENYPKLAIIGDSDMPSSDSEDRSMVAPIEQLVGVNEMGREISGSYKTESDIFNYGDHLNLHGSAPLRQESLKKPNNGFSLEVADIIEVENDG